MLSAEFFHFHRKDFTPLSEKGAAIFWGLKGRGRGKKGSQA